MIIFLNLFLSLVCIVQRKEIEWGPFNLFLWLLIANWRFNMAIWLPVAMEPELTWSTDKAGFDVRPPFNWVPSFWKILSHFLNHWGPFWFSLNRGSVPLLHVTHVCVINANLVRSLLYWLCFVVFLFNDLLLISTVLDNNTL